ncbi:glucose-1-phosphate cytidylyltransferase [Rhizosphaericola mali]|uniref:Glucose-1-phosphate cytidylyltransferase n=1 Tax=Rhizosphaericola mali TaxID=2545455 RepID=A0A5P2G7L9_9BACT|nr:glucose-1-phosphate cytidylyltransferase [Rhizosphaericola mali]QES89203.1 glucose-1-phosphate cytidylyltransferase [Rhizosphaericola mali]
MKVVILAGGLGTRLSEETGVRPKPMVEIGGMPILWHIMKIYSQYGFNDFVICLGYKGHVIKEYFANYFLYKSDVTIDLEKNSIYTHGTNAEPWRITLVDTGDDSMTGGRIKRIEPYVNGEPFFLTYGDGVANIDVKSLLEFHQKNAATCTVTAVQPTGRFGALNIQEDNKVYAFAEKPKGDGIWINGGYFVCQPEIFNYIQEGDATIWERAPLENLASENQMAAYKHNGFWRPMDTLKDKMDLNELWNEGKAPWKIW